MKSRWITAVCFLLSSLTTLSAKADYIANGGFETLNSTDATKFADWDYGILPGTTGAITQPTVESTSAIAGTHSVEVRDTTTSGNGKGYIGQTVSSHGLSDFTFSCDFAAISNTGTNRSFNLWLQYGEESALTMIQLKVAGSALSYYSGGWVSTGLSVALTANTLTASIFDGEAPVKNTLTVTGDFNAATPYYTISLVNNIYTGGTTTSQITGFQTSAPSETSGNTLNYIKFSGGKDAAYLVDNVILAPEPGTVVLLLTGLLGLAFQFFRKRK